ncbi:hypothetical protein [Streptomyces sp. NBC_00059]|uniref:hypothetical protein n=1 Tax=Streptomyces sp. NBC_00059 TaxID=2975635 RepID=UPI00225B69D6|nr:hypothetical protein [Streptomyces sp. NBC_00059]MCX5414878.1 hypothetical protein [Streptomyces sp. NBC_00059]
MPCGALGSALFGRIWFSLLATPFLLVACSASLLFLYFTDSGGAWALFHLLWVVNLVCYLLIVDRQESSAPDERSAPRVASTNQAVGAASAWSLVGSRRGGVRPGESWRPVPP